MRALVRPGSDATALESAGVSVVRGDMLEPSSLDAAFDGVDAVVTSAAGYTKRRKTDTDQTDTEGNRNLADAAKRAGVRRFVFLSILRSDEARDVPHFWHKARAERYLAEQRRSVRLAATGRLLRSDHGHAAGRRAAAGSCWASGPRRCRRRSC